MCRWWVGYSLDKTQLRRFLPLEQMYMTVPGNL